jgi:endonuclease G, mitochondrial
MKNKVIIGGIIALAIFVLIGIFCVWVVREGVERIKKPEEANVSKPVPAPQPPIITRPTTAEEAQRVYLAFGNPSGASQSDPNNYLLANNSYVNSYSRDRGIPNWVAWRVTRADMGNLRREDSFRPDDRLPKDWTRVVPRDYTGSGFDRGHLAPNADRHADAEAQAATFLMTNIVPQTPDLNRGPWVKLEGYLRTLVTRGSDVYIYAGAYGDNGKLKNKVTIPSNNWKIAVVVPAGSDPSAVNENTRVIAVDMPNVKGIKNADWQIYRTTVSEIEKNTGYNFFTNLPPKLQNKLKNKKDNINN